MRQWNEWKSLQHEAHIPARARTLTAGRALTCAVNDLFIGVSSSLTRSETEICIVYSNEHFSTNEILY